MKKTIVFTTAYNAGKTIRRAMDSVLCQSYNSFAYYVCDNGSLDNTRDIILEYAQKDERVIPVLYDENDFTLPFWNFIYDLPSQKEYSYFCLLDADDEYNPDFLEKTLEFINKNHLDIAVCGSDFVDMLTNQLTGKRAVAQDLILSGDAFDNRFSVYHQFTRTIWGKLYKIETLIKCDFENYTDIRQTKYGADTLFCMRAFLRSKRVGILAETLHKYYVSHKSVSYKYNNTRFSDDVKQHTETMNYLLDKTGHICPENKAFLYAVFYNAVKDTLKALFNSQTGFDEKLNGLREIFTNTHTREMLGFDFRQYNYFDINADKNKMFGVIYDFIKQHVFTKKENKNYIDTAADILSVIDIPPEKPDNWDNADYFGLLVMIYEKSLSDTVKTQIQGKITRTAAEDSLLTGLNADFLTAYPDIFKLILTGDLSGALTGIKNITEEKNEIQDTYRYLLISIALRLSASLKQPELLKYFTDKQAEYLLI